MNEEQRKRAGDATMTVLRREIARLNREEEPIVLTHWLSEPDSIEADVTWDVVNNHNESRDSLYGALGAYIASGDDPVDRIREGAEEEREEDNLSCAVALHRLADRIAESLAGAI